MFQCVGYLYFGNFMYLQEFILSSGYICQFNDFQIKLVLLDEIMKDLENFIKDNMVEMEIKVKLIGEMQII